MGIIFLMGKKVLIISNVFPPINNSGTNRILNFVDNLPFFGWEPIIVATRTPTSINDHLDFLSINRIRKGIKVAYVDLVNMREMSSKIRNTPFLWRMWNVMFFPDESIYWAVLAWFRALKLALFDRDIKVIVCSAPPFSVFLGLIFARVFIRIPVVLDFRDPWNEHNFLFGKRDLYSRVRFYAEKFIEDITIRLSNRIVVVTPPMKHLPEFRKYSRKIDCVPNSYGSKEHINDKVDMPQAEEFQGMSQFFNIVYVGRIHSHLGMSTKYFVRAFENMAKKNKLFHEKARIYFIGRADLHLYDIDDYIRDNIIAKGFLSKREIMGYYKFADILLFINVKKGSEYIATSKIYEYISLGKHVLVLTGDGISKEIFRGAGVGMICNPDDTTDIENSISVMFSQWLKGELKAKPDWGYIQQFEGKAVTGKLANMLDSVGNLCHNHNRPAGGACGVEARKPCSSK